MVQDPEIAVALTRRMERDIESSVQVSEHDWAFRPLSQRMLEYFFYSFRKLF